jgi:AmmeMemoRadiSam system protein B/AmmeMemoRadiSam system protein A
MIQVRSPAVAGMFYPECAHELQAILSDVLSDAASRVVPGPVPKAIIAPHAGYVYSGPIAASAYARLQPVADIVTRVVLIGPSHRVPLRGLAAPSVDAFETPLGRVELDRAAIADVLALPQVREWDAPHADEHSLEVHLPFLQAIFPRFALIPLAAGDASPEEVAEVLERLWGGPETLIVISSDLSHYLDYAAARRLDSATCRAIEALDARAIGYDQACGRVPVAGLLTLARRKRLSVTTLDLRNSGDTACDRRRVVGYGAWMFAEKAVAGGWERESEEQAQQGADFASATRRMLDRHGATLLHVAAASIEHGLLHAQPLPVTSGDYAHELRGAGASFVTLSDAGRLRGCVGSAEAHRPLIEDVAVNGFAAAFRDGRFPGLVADERYSLRVSVSVLSPPQPLRFADEAELLGQLRPGRDGLIISSDGRRALFLPQVWEALGEAHDFVGHLKEKAGLTRVHWSSDFRAWRFVTESISTDALPARAVWS